MANIGPNTSNRYAVKLPRSKHLVVYLLGVLSVLPSLACRGRGKAYAQERRDSGLIQEDRANDTLHLVFAGDIMTHGPQIRAALGKEGQYDFTPSFSLVKPLIEQADLAIGNLETTFGGKPYSGYPMFSSPEAFGSALRDAGFDVLTTANNHSCDRGRFGVINTIDVLDSLGIATTGSYRIKEERTSRTPLLVTVKGVKLAILAYTYGTNGLPIPHPALVDTISRDQIARDLQRADSLGADYKIVQIHWGNEYERLPNKRQKDLAQWLTDQGVHAIIGSHPHVVQESAFLKRQNTQQDSTFVVYSMGNFISNQITPPGTRGGMLLSLDLIRDRAKGSWTTHPHYQYVFVEKRSPKGETIYRLRPIQLSDSSYVDLAHREAVDLQALQRYYRSITLAP